TRSRLPMDCCTGSTWTLPDSPSSTSGPTVASPFGPSTTPPISPADGASTGPRAGADPGDREARGNATGGWGGCRLQRPDEQNHADGGADRHDERPQDGG